jgi:hypothetical protein
MLFFESAINADEPRGSDVKVEVFSLSRHFCYKNLHYRDRAFARRCGMMREG